MLFFINYTYIKKNINKFDQLLRCIVLLTNADCPLTPLFYVVWRLWYSVLNLELLPVHCKHVTTKTLFSFFLITYNKLAMSGEYLFFFIDIFMANINVSKHHWHRYSSPTASKVTICAPAGANITLMSIIMGIKPYPQ